MSKYLRHNLTSQYLEAARRMSPRKKRRRIVAYVESYDDICFWRSVLSQYEDESRYFEIMLPSTKTLQHGKKTVLMSSLGSAQLGQNLIACVDSDYDFLMQGSTDSSRQLMGSDYVFQTYTYAIENYMCNPASLHAACVAATLNDRRIFDFEAFMTRYSEIVYPLFVWHMYFYRHGDFKTFPMKRFNDDTLIHDVSIKTPGQTLDNLAYRVRHAVSYWERRFPHYAADMDGFGQSLARLGVAPQNVYLYMQGHHIMDNVVMRLLTPVCTALRREQEDLIKRKSMHATQRANELAGYENSALPVETVLRKSVSFNGIFLYRWILDDLNRVFSPRET